MNDPKEMYFYDGFADQFDQQINYMYDVRRRVELIFGELLPKNLGGLRLLDAGCGTGWFSAEAVARGAQVVSVDVGLRLLDRVAQKCTSTKRLVGSVLELPFGRDTFDVVICTEVIEHTPNPGAAISELCRVVRPGGIVIVTVPNVLWKPMVVLANALGLRPYEGLENFVSFRFVRSALTKGGMRVEVLRGLCALPVRMLQPLISRLNAFGAGPAGWLMTNVIARAQKPEV